MLANLVGTLEQKLVLFDQKAKEDELRALKDDSEDDGELEDIQNMIKDLKTKVNDIQKYNQEEFS